MNVQSKNNYLELFEEKKKSFSCAFNKDSSIEYFPSHSRAYRHRAEFSLINKKDDLSFAMTANGRKEKINTFFDDWLVLGLNIPALVIIILCYVWFGLNEIAAILAVSINKIPMVAVILREGARSIEKEYIEVAKFYNISDTKLVSKVILPQLYPYLMSAARSGLSLIWKIVLVVELLGRSNGVGFKLYGFFQFFDISGILAYTLSFVFVILVVEFIFVRPLEKRLTKWR